MTAPANVTYCSNYLELILIFLLNESPAVVLALGDETGLNKVYI